MRHKYRLRATQTVAVLLLASLAVGCGEEKAAVSGHVTLDGRPLEVRHRMKGTIVFHALSKSQAGQVQSAALDKDGAYLRLKSRRVWHPVNMRSP